MSGARWDDGEWPLGDENLVRTSGSTGRGRAGIQWRAETKIASWLRCVAIAVPVTATLESLELSNSPGKKETDGFAFSNTAANSQWMDGW